MLHDLELQERGNVNYFLATMLHDLELIFYIARSRQRESWRVKIKKLQLKENGEKLLGIYVVDNCAQFHVDSLHPPLPLQHPKETEHMKLRHNCKQ